MDFITILNTLVNNPSKLFKLFISFSLNFSPWFFIKIFISEISWIYLLILIIWFNKRKLLLISSFNFPFRDWFNFDKNLTVSKLRNLIKSFVTLISSL